MTKNTSRALRTLVAVAMVALMGAGCSNGSSENGGSGGNTNRDQAMKFAECMRDNGISEFPDPDASGELTIDGVLNGSSLDPNSAAWQNATAACEDLQPPGFTGDKNVTDEEQRTRLEFAQCMRDNGVEDFPDPAKDEPLVDTNRIPSSATEGGMTAIDAAMEKCGDVVADLMGGQQ